MFLVVSSVGDTFILGAHDKENCHESEGCVKVQITESWIHEEYIRTSSPCNDIAVVK